MDKDVINRAFPDHMIKSRPGPGGRPLSYVEGAAVVHRLNEAFDHQWSLEILEERILDDEVLCRVRLTAENLSKDAWGGQERNRSRNGEYTMVLADCLKSATTDALKKASSLFGIGLHLWLSDDESHDVIPSESPRDQRPPAPNNSASPRSNDAQRPTNLATHKQLTTIMEISARCGWSTEHLREYLAQTYHSSSKNLTKKDASDCIGYLFDELKRLSAEKKAKKGGSQ